MDNILIEKRIATELKNARKRLKLSQVEVGEKMEKTQNWVKNIELGKTALSLNALIKLCNIYQIEISEIFKKLGL